VRHGRPQPIGHTSIGDPRHGRDVVHDATAKPRRVHIACMRSRCSAASSA
jgi:hypothetical protein